MVQIESNTEMHAVWMTEAYTTPLFEEVQRLLAMHEFSIEQTDVFPSGIELVVSGEITFALYRQATAEAMIDWRNGSSHLLGDAILAEWKDARLIVIQTK